MFNTIFGGIILFNIITYNLDVGTSMGKFPASLQMKCYPQI